MEGGGRRGSSTETLITMFNQYLTAAIASSYATWRYKVLNNRILGYIEIKRGSGDLVLRWRNSVDISESSTLVDYLTGSGYIMSMSGCQKGFKG